MNCWGITVKDVWDVPRETHRVCACWLSDQCSSFQEDLLAQWVKFYQSVITGPSLKVAVIARAAAGDQRMHNRSKQSIDPEHHWPGRPHSYFTAGEEPA